MAQISQSAFDDYVDSVIHGKDCWGKGFSFGVPLPRSVPGAVYTRVIPPATSWRDLLDKQAMHNSNVLLDTLIMEEVFKVGDPVEKTGGEYQFVGEVRGVVVKKTGGTRYVVEDDRGCLHIFGAKNLKRRVPKRSGYVLCKDYLGNLVQVDYWDMGSGGRLVGGIFTTKFKVKNTEFESTYMPGWVGIGPTEKERKKCDDEVLEHRGFKPLEWHAGK